MPKLQNLPKLSKASQDAFNDFDGSAMSWGLQEERGVGRDVASALKNYNVDKLRLARRIAYLERAAKKARRAGSI